jgi:2-hydroxychromene-2-carboxylate isomerase
VATPPEQPAFFYFDLSDPWSYLVAERILGVFPVICEWQPVYGPQLGWTAPALAGDELAVAIAERNLQPLRLPRSWPPDSRRAMLAATFAKSGGKTVGFSLAAFRQVFAGGRDLGDEATVLLAAAACEMHPRALLKAIAMRSVSDSLRRAGEQALTAGVRTLPAIQVAGDVFAGPDALDRALARPAVDPARAG